MIEIVIDLLIGVGAGVFGLIFQRYTHERFLIQITLVRILSVVAFIIGLVCLYALLETGLPWNQLSFLTFLAAILVFIANGLRIHKVNGKVYEEASRSSWFAFRRPVEMRRGYFESKVADDSDNAWNTRFGHTTLGRNSERGVWAKLFGRDGWTRSQRKALLRHEAGHTINALPAYILETFLFCWALTGVTWSLQALLILPALFAAITLMAWLDELAADSIAGFCGFSLESLFSRNKKWDHYFVGSLGSYSHPPHILRWLAFLTRIFVLILWGLAGWAVYWTFISS